MFGRSIAKGMLEKSHATSPSSLLSSLGVMPVAAMRVQKTAGAVENCAAGTRYGWGRNDTPRHSDPVPQGSSCEKAIIRLH